jgi:hypothetical protein
MFSWTTYAADLCRKAAPLELAEQQVYVIDAARDKLDMPPDAGGFTAFSLDICLRSHLESKGLWSGRGFTTVIDPTLLSDGEPPYVSEARAIAISIHELAHHIEHLAIDATVRAANLGSLSDCEPFAYAAHVASSMKPPTDEPWRAHGLPFLRSFLHLLCRLGGHGINIIGETRAAGPRYGLSPLAAYHQAIGTEPAECVGRSLVDVLRTPAPLAMAALFASDTAAFKARAA